MKIVLIVARLLLGLVFLVFGLNGLLHFMPNPPEPPAADAFFLALYGTGYMFALVFGTQVIGGALLILGVAVPFALAILAPVIVNIIAFHLFLAPAGLPVAIVVAALRGAPGMALSRGVRAAVRPRLPALTELPRAPVAKPKRGAH